MKANLVKAPSREKRGIRRGASPPGRRKGQVSGEIVSNIPWDFIVSLPSAIF